MRSTRLALTGITAAAVVAALVPAAASAATSATPPTDDRGVLLQYAQDTWASFEAMVEPATALPADNVDGDLDPATRSRYTSPTNIGGYLWSTIVARDLGLIDRSEAYQRMDSTVATVARLDRHDDSGMFYNWYDPQTLDVLRVWPEDGNTVYPFLSSVDNGWLAAALRIVAAAEPRLRRVERRRPSRWARRPASSRSGARLSHRHRP